MKLVSSLTTPILNLLVTKPIAIFAWWLSHRANRIEFPERAELRRRVAAATRAGRPVLFASNHVSMFDDPVLPMTLFGTGQRALAELLVLAGLLLLCWGVPTPIAWLAALAWAAGCGLFGAQKVWWSLGDLVNFSGAAALRGKLEAGGDGSLSRTRLALLALADRAIRHFMRSGVVKTVLIDRRAGDEAKRARSRSVEEAIEIASRAEPLWIFFEGGRAKLPGEVGPARRGLGDIFLGLRARGLDPLVVAIRHRGLERVMPRGSSRWLTSGHQIEVQWSEWSPASGAQLGAGEAEAQLVADAVRDQVSRMQPGKPDAAPRLSQRPGRLVYRTGLSFLSWLFMVVACVVWGVLVIPPTLLLSRLWPGVRQRFNDLTRRFVRLYVRSLLFVRFEVENAEQRLRDARIVVANHQSWLDPIVMISLEPRLGGPIRSYLYRVPVLGSIVRLAGFYPSDSWGLESVGQLHRSAEAALEDGGGLLFFPEGTRSRTGEIGPFHRGAFRAAVDHDLPIQPVVIDGLDRVLPPGHLICQVPRRHSVRIRYLAPIEPPFGSGVRRDVVRALSDRVRDALIDDLARLRRERDEAPERAERISGRGGP